MSGHGESSKNSIKTAGGLLMSVVALGGQTLKTDAYAWLGAWLVVPAPSLDDPAQTEVSAYPARSTQVRQEGVNESQTSLPTD